MRAGCQRWGLVRAFPGSNPRAVSPRSRAGNPAEAAKDRAATLPPNAGLMASRSNGPDGNKAKGDNPQNAEDALGRNDEFPEAGNLDKLLDEPGFNANPNPRRAEDANGGNQDALNPMPPIGQNPDGNNAPKVDPNPPPAGGDFQPHRNQNPARDASKPEINRRSTKTPCPRRGLASGGNPMAGRPSNCLRNRWEHWQFSWAQCFMFWPGRF